MRTQKLYVYACRNYRKAEPSPCFLHFTVTLNLIRALGNSAAHPLPPSIFFPPSFAIDVWDVSKVDSACCVVCSGAWGVL